MHRRRRRIQAAHRTLSGHFEEPKLKGAPRNSKGCVSRAPAFRRALVLLKNANLAAKRSRIEIRRSATTSGCLTLRLLAAPLQEADLPSGPVLLPGACQQQLTVEGAFQQAERPVRPSAAGQVMYARLPHRRPRK